MESLLHLLDYHQGSMARKFLRNKRHVGGLEPPRNSLDLPLETTKSYYTFSDVDEVNKNISLANHYPSTASMKNLINEEISKQQNTRRNTPSIVARLMGMDMTPSDTKLVIEPIGETNRNLEINLSGKKQIENGSTGQIPFSSNLSRQINPDILDSGKKPLGKPRHREHPQEEELQKFKKEFEAWQAARFKKCSRIVENGSISKQLLAQEDLNREKMSLYAQSGRVDDEDPEEHKGHPWTVMAHEREGLQHERHNSELSPTYQKKSLPIRSQAASKELELFPLIKSDHQLNRSSAPTRIVLLRPGPDKIGNDEESRASSSSTVDGGSIEDFLEEVKERLKSELQVKARKRNIVVRGGGIETPFSEKSSDPKMIARQIAKEVRESVCWDIGMNLVRSESTRSYKSEIQLHGPSSPEYIDRDTRKFLSERLRNVIKKDIDATATTSGSLGVSVVENEECRVQQIRELPKHGNRGSFWEIGSFEPEMHLQSFRHGPYSDFVPCREPSPGNLIRSLSAPVSGTSFGKLLLEDRHVSTGVQIRRKQEYVDNMPVDIKDQKKERLFSSRKKERFNLKEKVSSIRYSFTLRKKLFGKRNPSIEEHHVAKQDFVRDIMSGPTVIMNFGDRNENPTEVPPSPASICSSPNGELWRPTGYLSPISTPDVLSVDEDSVPHIFREISSNLSELRKQLNRLASDEVDAMTIKDELLTDQMAELTDPMEAYIRKLLVASGLYDGSADRSFLSLDPLAMTISYRTFEELEKSETKAAKGKDDSMKDQNEKVGHKVLLDLLNEALTNLLRPAAAVSILREKLVDSALLSPPTGRELLDLVWESIRGHVHPQADKFSCSLDSMVAKDLRSNKWSSLIGIEITCLGKEMEHSIVGDLIEEVVNEMVL